MDASNSTFIRQSEQFYEKLKERLKENSNCAVKLVAGRFFVDEKIVKLNDKNTTGAETVKIEWDQLGVGGIQFAESVNLPEIEQLFKIITEIKPQTHNIDTFSDKLKSLNLNNIQLLSQKKVNENNDVITEEMRRQFRLAARKTFFQAVDVVQEVVTNTAHDKDINMSKTKRVVHSLIDHIMRDESSLIELTAIKNYDDYTYAHSTNVTIYSLTLGVKLGLDRARLSQLGFTALFHDVGKVKLPVDLIRKPDAFDENDWIQMQKHPHLGAKTILRNMKFDMHVARAARGAFEHHINNDFTGYPLLRYKKIETNLFSKIISIVDTFDALTSGRVYLKKSLETADVIKKMQYQMKVKFDEFLLKLFVNIIGVYPAGTMVLLSTDELAIILSNNETDKDKPYVKILGDHEKLFDQPLWADLSQPEHEERKIVRRVEPEKYGLDIKDFILET